MTTQPYACFRDTPERPERPERERRDGPGRWFFIAVVFLVLLVLDRILGPLGAAVLWAVGLGSYYGVRAYRAWNRRK